MMNYLRDTIIPSGVYNSLPPIEENADVPEKYAADLEYLRGLLVKHSIPNSVSVRLIHIHYDTKDGEVMVFKTVKVPDGIVRMMRPVLATDCKSLCPINYFVDEDRRLQAYEYTTDETHVPNLQDHKPFLEEFCRTVSKRGLERKFGLKIRDHDEFAELNWSEYEFPGKRSTIMIPEGLPAPENDSTGFSVMTEWSTSSGDKKRPHCYSHCRSHCKGHAGPRRNACVAHQVQGYSSSGGKGSGGSDSNNECRSHKKRGVCASHCRGHAAKGRRNDCHSHQKTGNCASHCKGHDGKRGKGDAENVKNLPFRLGGQQIAVGSPVHKLVNDVLKNWS